MTAPRDPHLRPAPGRHRAPVTPTPPRRFRKRHVAVVAAAMVAMAWLPAELADVPIGPAEAVAAEEQPGNDTAVIHRTPVRGPERAQERRTAHSPSRSTPEPAKTTSAPETTVAPEPVATTPTPDAEPPTTTTSPAPTTAASPPSRQPQTTQPRHAWPTNCGGAT